MPKKSYGEHDRQSIGYLISRVVAWKGRLESLQNAMKDSGVDQLTVEGQVLTAYENPTKSKEIG